MIFRFKTSIFRGVIQNEELNKGSFIGMISSSIDIHANTY